MRLSNEWKDYKIIDAGNGEKLEDWNGIVLRRPDPQAIWNTTKNDKWNNPDGYYHRSSKGGGNWEFTRNLQEYWTVNYKDLTFKVTPTNFKHTGLFPEQAINWDFAMKKIKESKREIKVLNLFAYTGAATMACSKAGATEVVHVDAAKGMIEWAKENMRLSNLENNYIRFIVDDCLKFVEREARRGHKYDVGAQMYFAPLIMKAGKNAGLYFRSVCGQRRIGAGGKAGRCNTTGIMCKPCDRRDNTGIYFI